MDEGPRPRVDEHLRAEVRTLIHDLVRARENLATGRLKPEHYAALEKILMRRVDRLEGEVQARLPGKMGWKPPRGGAS